MLSPGKMSYNFIAYHINFKWFTSAWDSCHIWRVALECVLHTTYVEGRMLTLATLAILNAFKAMTVCYVHDEGTDEIGGHYKNLFHSQGVGPADRQSQNLCGGMVSGQVKFFCSYYWCTWCLCTRSIKRRSESASAYPVYEKTPHSSLVKMV